MSHKIRDLRALSDERLVKLHDELAVNTQVGIGYYLDEFRRRETAAAMAASNKLARASFILTVFNAILAVIAIAVSVAVSLR